MYEAHEKSMRAEFEKVGKELSIGRKEEERKLSRLLERREDKANSCGRVQELITEKDGVLWRRKVEITEPWRIEGFDSSKFNKSIAQKMLADFQKFELETNAELLALRIEEYSLKQELYELDKEIQECRGNIDWTFSTPSWDSFRTNWILNQEKRLLYGGREPGVTTEFAQREFDKAREYAKGVRL